MHCMGNSRLKVEIKVRSITSGICIIVASIIIIYIVANIYGERAASFFFSFGFFV